MAVDLTIDGDLYPNAYSYTVTEDSTPVDPSDTSGGVGQFTFSMNDSDDVLAMKGKVVDLEDGSQGTTVGVIRALNGSDGVANLTADSRLSALNAERNAKPYIGTLDGAFRYYLGLCGITTDIVVDASISGRRVVYQGWSGNVWDNLKAMLTAESIEVSLVSDMVVLRPLRQRDAETYRDSSINWTIDEQQQARSVEVYYYQPRYYARKLAYPTGGWNEDVQVYSVNAGETLDPIEIPIEASLLSVEQPVCVSSVDRNHVASSVYTVTGTGEGSTLPITPSQWRAGGGSVRVEIGDDTRTLKLYITGSSETRYAPYEIAMTAGPSDSYSSLRIVGEGVFTDRRLLTLETGVDHDRVATEIGATVDNSYIDTEAKAYALGLWTLKRWGGPRYSINVTSSGINRLGDSGGYRFPKIEDFNTEYAGLTIADFNQIWAGKTIEDFNEYWIDQTKNDFANQAFGNVAGARVPYRDAMFRIRSATITPDRVSYSAEEDTTIADFNAVWAGKTIADFNAQWAGKLAAEFNLKPLHKDEEEDY